MTTIAEVLNGSVINIIRDPAKLERVPMGKRVPMITEYSDFDPITQTRSGPEIIIESDKVVQRYVIADHPEALARLAAHVTTKLNEKFESESVVVRNGYTESAVATFDQQKEEAVSYTSDSSASTPMLDALASTRGIDKDILVERILDKAGLYSSTMGLLLGMSQKIEDMIDVAVDDEDLDELHRIDTEELTAPWLGAIS